jgi:hypothetical protein
MFKIATITLAMLFSIGMTCVAIPSVSAEDYDAPEFAEEEEGVPATDDGDLSYDESQGERETVGEDEALEQEGADEEEKVQLQYEEE